MHDNNLQGQLIDYDLVSNDWRHTPSIDPAPVQETGGTPFIALDFLSSPRGEVQPLYRHDLKSFVWVLIWIICRYTDAGKVIDKAP